MATTARPQNPITKRNVTTDSVVSSSANSASVSPFDSPAGSASNTSLSSLGSVDESTVKNARGTLLDTYGNEFEIPDYTIKDIRDAIPKHCFERSGARGLYYVARDIASLAATFYLFHNYVTPENIPSTPVRAALWAGYTFMQGLFGTGLWVMAHECGHQSFSPSKVLNDTVGFIAHTALLVPYFSWKISHGKHHKATGHMERDMVFVPKTRDVYASRVGKLAHQLDELTEETPIATLIHSIGQQLGGWPMYLLSNVTGHDYHERQPEGKGKGKKNGFFSGVNHFNPSSPLYEKKDEHLILASDAGLAIVIATLWYIGKTYGFSNLLVWYFIPYLWVNHWLVATQSAFAIPPSLLTAGSVEHYGQVTPPEELSPAALLHDPAREGSIPVEELQNEALFPDHQVQALQNYQPQQAAQEPAAKRRRTSRQSSAKDPASAQPQQEGQPPKRKRGRPKSTPQLVEHYTADGFPFQVSSARQSHLEKNRVAAHKCRQRKKEYINGLEARAREFSSKNKALKENVAMLREEVLELKNEVLRHAGCGFWAVDEYLARCAGDLLGMDSPLDGPKAASRTSTTRPQASPVTSTSSLGSESLRRPSSTESVFSAGSSPGNDDYNGLDFLQDIDEGEESQSV